MQVIGRDRELEEIDRLLTHAAEGRGGLVVIVGPQGSGTTTLADATVDRARQRGFEVLRSFPAPGGPPRLLWAQLLRDVGAPDDVAVRVLEGGGPLDLDTAARRLVSASARLFVIDDIDRAGQPAVEVLSVVAARAATGPTAVLATSRVPLGVGLELRLEGLSESQLGAAVGETRPVVRHALWVASRGLPGVARSLASDIARGDEDLDPVAHLALVSMSTVEFLAVDIALVRLIELALQQARDDRTRARLLAKLAHELLGDAAAAARRRALIEEALALARSADDARTLAEVLDARLHALWDPAAAADRLASASEIIDLARATGDGVRERHGMFWRFIALMELGRVDEAESALAAYARAAATAGDAEASVMATARHAMLAILRGRFDQADRLIAEVARTGPEAGRRDTADLVGTLRGAIDMERDMEATATHAVEIFEVVARQRPGHYFEAARARVLLALGRDAEAAAELERVLPRVLTGSGPRWLGAVSELAAVAAGTHDAAAAARLHEVLAPYRERLVVRGGANAVVGPASHYLGLLAIELGRVDDAIADFDTAIAMQEQIGALPGLAHSLDALAAALTIRSHPGDLEAASEHRRRARTIAERLGMASLLRRLAPPRDEWTLRRDAGDWVLQAAGERTRLRDGPGVRYLRSLLAAPAHDIAALDLVAGGAGLVASDTGPMYDAAAGADYRRRLDALDAEIDSADRRGDAEGARRAEAEREALLAELRRARRIGGRVRDTSAEAERARVNVTRGLRATIDRIAASAPRAAAHLRASIRTGRACRYDPAPGGPARWHV